MPMIEPYPITIAGHSYTVLERYLVTCPGTVEVKGKRVIVGKPFSYTVEVVR